MEEPFFREARPDPIDELFELEEQLDNAGARWERLQLFQKIAEAEERAYYYESPRKTMFDGVRFSPDELRTLRVKANNERTGDNELKPDDWKRIVASFDGRCAYCGDECKKPVIEHVVPVCRGGRTVKTNVVPACKGCNSRKSRRRPEEWLTPDDFQEFLDDWVFGSLYLATMPQKTRTPDDL